MADEGAAVAETRWRLGPFWVEADEDRWRAGVGDRQCVLVQEVSFHAPLEMNPSERWGRDRTLRIAMGHVFIRIGWRA